MDWGEEGFCVQCKTLVRRQTREDGTDCLPPHQHEGKSQGGSRCGYEQDYDPLKVATFIQRWQSNLEERDAACTYAAINANELARKAEEEERRAQLADDTATVEAQA